jgi:glucans biosynthesis protein C
LGKNYERIVKIKMSKIEKNRNSEIETLRGLACLALVCYHVIGSTSDQGMKAEAHTLWRVLADMSVYIVIPLFALISGYAYGYFNGLKTDYKDYFIGKLRRLGLPLITATSAFLLGAYVMGNEYALPLDRIYEAYLFSYAHFWYLQASVIAFAIVLIFDYFELLNTKNKLFSAFIISAIASIYVPYLPDFFSINGAVLILPYFLLGLLLKRHNPSFNIVKKVTLISLTVCLFSMIVFISFNPASILPSFPIEINKHSIIGIVTSALFCLSVFSVRLSFKPLERIGFYSYSIYLYHIFFTSGWRAFATKFEIDGLLLFISSLFFGIAIPILMEIIISRVPLLKLIVLGEKIKKKI